MNTPTIQKLWARQENLDQELQKFAKTIGTGLKQSNFLHIDQFSSNTWSTTEQSHYPNFTGPQLLTKDVYLKLKN